MFSMRLPDDSTVNVGLAVGLTVGLFFGLGCLCCCAVPSCIGVIVYCDGKKRARNTRTSVIATTPSTGPSVVTSTRDTSFTNTPTTYPYPRQPYPTQFTSDPYSTQFTPDPYSTQFTPTPYSTQPQPVYKDAQFSYGEAPPSYNAALSFPSYTAPVTVSQLLYLLLLLKQ